MILPYNDFTRTNAEVSTYIQTEFLVNISTADLAEALIQYPEDITQGSPFDTGILNAITPQFKRIAAFIGGAVFQGPRRFFLQNLSGKQPIWSYGEALSTHKYIPFHISNNFIVSKRFKLTLPVLGSVRH